MDRDSVVHISFPIQGQNFPLDHGYKLFSAISHLVPLIHDHPSWGIHPIYGKRSGIDTLQITPYSRLIIQIPDDHIKDFLPLSQSTLEVDGHKIVLGFPQILPLIPSSHLLAKIVTIKGFNGEVEPFLNAVRRQISNIENLGQSPESIEITIRGRRILKIKDTIIVGFQIGLSGLCVDVSLKIQEHGLGGRRHMGAGIFVPVR